MNEIKIPKSFMLMGQTIQVIMKDDLSFKDGNWGEANLRTNVIFLQANAKGHNRNKDQVEDTFIHELVHFILDLGGDTKLSEDEPFVKRFSSLLHQALKTADYEDFFDASEIEKMSPQPIRKADDMHKLKEEKRTYNQIIRDEYPH